MRFFLVKILSRSLRRARMPTAKPVPYRTNEAFRLMEVSGSGGSADLYLLASFSVGK